MRSHRESLDSFVARISELERMLTDLGAPPTDASKARVLRQGVGPELQIATMAMPRNANYHDVLEQLRYIRQQQHNGRLNQAHDHVPEDRAQQLLLGRDLASRELT